MGVDLHKLREMDTNDLYSATLRAQTELHSTQTRKILGRLDEWKRAKRVLDAGCGPGNFPFVLSELFEKKDYVGIDLEPRFIDEARTNNEGDHLNFRCANLLEYTEGPFDFIYLFAVLQYLPNLDEALAHLATLLDPKGAILIGDTAQDQREVTVEPAIAPLTQMYRELAEKKDSTRHSDVIGDIKAKCESYGFEVVREEPMEVSIASSDGKAKFARYVLQVSELLERLYGIATNQIALRRELETWESTKGSKATLAGGQYVVLKLS